MESKELYKLFKQIRILSYINLPVIESEDPRIIKQKLGQGWKFSLAEKGPNDFRLCRESDYLEEGSLKKKAIKNFKINSKTLDDYFNEENTKDRLVERISQAVAFSEGEMDGLALTLCSYFAPVFGYIAGPLSGLHEIGHALGSGLVYKDIIHHIYVEGFENFKIFLNEPSPANFMRWLFGYDLGQDLIGGYHWAESTSGYPYQLSPIGEKLGRKASRGIHAASGVAFDSFLSFLLYVGGFIFRKRKLGRLAMNFSKMWYVSPVAYSALGIFFPGAETAIAAECFGIHPIVFTALIAAPQAIAMSIAHLKDKFDRRKEERRHYVDYIISSGKVSLDEVLEHFQSHGKSKKIDFIEKKLAGMAEYLFYCERKEQKKITKRIKKGAKILLNKYVGFVDLLGKKYENKIKEQKGAWEFWLIAPFVKDYVFFRDELSLFGVPEKEIEKIYDMLHSAKIYEAFCIKKKKNEVAEKFMKKAGLSPNIWPLNKVVSALYLFYEGESLNLRRY